MPDLKRMLEFFTARHAGGMQVRVQRIVAANDPGVGALLGRAGGGDHRGDELEVGNGGVGEWHVAGGGALIANRGGRDHQI